MFLPPLNPIVVKPQLQTSVRGEFKVSQSAEALLQSRSKVSSQSIVRANNRVAPVNVAPRNPVSRAHTLQIGDPVQALIATRNREQRVVLCGESGIVDGLYRSGRIHVLWSGGGSGWYTISELRQKGVRGP